LPFQLFLNKIGIITFLLQVIERKGLDMVRRDWSLLSKELGDFCLAQILSGGYAILSFFFYSHFDFVLGWNSTKVIGVPIYLVTPLALVLTGHART